MRVRVLVRYLLIALVAVCTPGCINDDEPDLTSLVSVGDHLPIFSVELNDGSTLTTEMLRGSESMIVFFTTECADCRRELPRINAYALAHPQVRVVCIARSEGAQQIAAFWEAEGLSLPYSPQPDRAVYSMFATAGVPRIYCADASLRVTAEYLEEFPLWPK